MADIRYYVDSESDPPELAPLALFRIISDEHGTDGQQYWVTAPSWRSTTGVVSMVSGQGGDIYWLITAEQADAVIARWVITKQLFAPR